MISTLSEFASEILPVDQLLESRGYVALFFVGVLILVFYITRIQSMFSRNFDIYSLIGMYLYFSSEAISRILERCTLMTESYYPVPWLLTGHSRSRAAAAAAEDIPQYEREILKAPNGSTVAIDWFDHPEEVNKKFTGLLLIMNHACNGNSSLVQFAIANAHKYNLGCCLLTMPGIAGLPLSSPHVGFQLTFMVELQAIIDRINQHVGLHFPKVTLAFSLGGVPLIEFASASPFFSQVYISLPLKLDSFDSEFFLSQAKRILKENADFITESHPHLSDASSLKELMAQFSTTTPSSPLVAIDNLTRPTLFIYAIDDPYVPFYDSVDLLRLCKNKNVAVAVTNVGGHCGFQTITPGWIIDASLEFLANSVKP